MPIMIPRLLQHLFGAQEVMVVLGKTMGLIAHILQELQSRRMCRQTNRCVLSLFVDQLFFLGQADQGSGFRAFSVRCRTDRFQQETGQGLLGSVKLPLARRLEIDEARVGGMVSVFGFTMIPVMFAVGFVTDLVGKQPVMIGGSVIMAVSLVVLATAGTYWPALAGVLLLSAGWATLINVVNPLSLFAFPGTPSYALNLACFFFGLGAFLTPLAVAFLLRRVKLTATLLVLMLPSGKTCSSTGRSPSTSGW